MNSLDSKEKKSLTLTGRQWKSLANNGRALGVGISEYLRRLLDNEKVREAMNDMLPREK